ncbi:MAG: hypothetical protein WBD17_07820, partial [Candidatus Omnitrophota bacterium]
TVTSTFTDKDGKERTLTARVSRLEQRDGRIVAVTEGEQSVAHAAPGEAEPKRPPRGNEYLGALKTNSNYEITAVGKDEILVDGMVEYELTMTGNMVSMHNRVGFKATNKSGESLSHLVEGHTVADGESVDLRLANGLISTAADGTMNVKMYDSQKGKWVALDRVKGLEVAESLTATPHELPKPGEEGTLRDRINANIAKLPDEGEFKSRAKNVTARLDQAAELAKGSASQQAMAQIMYIDANNEVSKLQSVAAYYNAHYTDPAKAGSKGAVNMMFGADRNANLTLSEVLTRYEQDAGVRFMVDGMLKDLGTERLKWTEGVGGWFDAAVTAYNEIGFVGMFGGYAGARLMGLSSEDSYAAMQEYQQNFPTIWGKISGGWHYIAQVLGGATDAEAYKAAKEYAKHHSSFLGDLGIVGEVVGDVLTTVLFYASGNWQVYDSKEVWLGHMKEGLSIAWNDYVKPAVAGAATVVVGVVMGAVIVATAPLWVPVYGLVQAAIAIGQTEFWNETLKPAFAAIGRGIAIFANAWWMSAKAIGGAIYDNALAPFGNYIAELASQAAYLFSGIPEGLSTLFSMISEDLSALVDTIAQSWVGDVFSAVGTVLNAVYTYTGLKAIVSVMSAIVYVAAVAVAITAGIAYAAGKDAVVTAAIAVTSFLNKTLAPVGMTASGVYATTAKFVTVFTAIGFTIGAAVGVFTAGVSVLVGTIVGFVAGAVVGAIVGIVTSIAQYGLAQKGAAHWSYEWTATNKLMDTLSQSKTTGGRAAFETLNVAIIFADVFSFGIGGMIGKGFEVHAGSALKAELFGGVTGEHIITVIAVIAAFMMSGGLGGGAKTAAQAAAKTAGKGALRIAARGAALSVTQSARAAALAAGRGAITGASGFIGRVTGMLVTAAITAGRAAVTAARAVGRAVVTIARGVRDVAVRAASRVARLYNRVGIRGIAVKIIRQVVPTARAWAMIDMAVYTGSSLVQSALTGKSFGEMFNRKDLLAAGRGGFVNGAMFAAVFGAVRFVGKVLSRSPAGTFFRNLVKASQGQMEAKALTKALGASGAAGAGARMGAWIASTNAVSRSAMIIGATTLINVTIDTVQGDIKTGGDLFRSAAQGALAGLVMAYAFSVRGIAHIDSIFSNVSKIGGAVSKVAGNKIAKQAFAGAVEWMVVEPAFMVFNSILQGTELGAGFVSQVTKEKVKGWKALLVAATEAPLKGRYMKVVVGLFGAREIERAMGLGQMMSDRVSGGLFGKITTLVRYLVSGKQARMAMHVAASRGPIGLAGLLGRIPVVGRLLARWEGLTGVAFTVSMIGRALSLVTAEVKDIETGAVIERRRTGISQTESMFYSWALLFMKPNYTYKGGTRGILLRANNTLKSEGFKNLSAKARADVFRQISRGVEMCEAKGGGLAGLKAASNYMQARIDKLVRMRVSAIESSAEGKAMKQKYNKAVNRLKAGGTLDIAEGKHLNDPALIRRGQAKLNAAKRAQGVYDKKMNAVAREVHSAIVNEQMTEGISIASVEDIRAMAKAHQAVSGAMADYVRANVAQLSPTQVQKIANRSAGGEMTLKGFGKVKMSVDALQSAVAEYHGVTLTAKAYAKQLTDLALGKNTTMKIGGKKVRISGKSAFATKASRLAADRMARQAKAEGKGAMTRLSNEAKAVDGLKEGQSTEVNILGRKVTVTSANRAVVGATLLRASYRNVSTGELAGNFYSRYTSEVYDKGGLRKTTLIAELSSRPDGQKLLTRAKVNAAKQIVREAKAEMKREARKVGRKYYRKASGAKDGRLLELIHSKLSNAGMTHLTDVMALARNMAFRSGIFGRNTAARIAEASIQMEALGESEVIKEGVKEGRAGAAKQAQELSGKYKHMAETNAELAQTEFKAKISGVATPRQAADIKVLKAARLSLAKEMGWTGKQLRTSGRVARSMVKAMMRMYTVSGGTYQLTTVQVKALSAALTQAMNNSGTLDVTKAAMGMIGLSCGAGKSFPIVAMNLAFLEAKASEMGAKGMTKTQIQAALQKMKLGIVTDTATNAQDFLQKSEMDALKQFCKENGINITLVENAGQMTDAGGLFIFNAHSLMSTFYEKAGALKGFSMVNVDEAEAVFQSTRLSYSSLVNAWAAAGVTTQAAWKAKNALWEGFANRTMEVFNVKMGGKITTVSPLQRCGETGQIRWNAKAFNTEVKAFLSTKAGRSLARQVGGKQMAKRMLTAFANRATTTLLQRVNQAGSIKIQSDAQGRFVKYDLLGGGQATMANTQLGDSMSAMAVLFRAKAGKSIGGMGLKAKAGSTWDAETFNAFKTSSKGGVSIFEALNFIDANNAFGSKSVSIGWGGTIEGCRNILGAKGAVLYDLGTTGLEAMGLVSLSDGNCTGRLANRALDRYESIQASPNELMAIAGGAQGQSGGVYRAITAGAKARGMKVEMQTHGNALKFQEAFAAAAAKGPAALRAFGKKIHIVAECVTAVNLFKTNDAGFMKATGPNGQQIDMFNRGLFLTNGVNTSSNMLQQAARGNIQVTDANGKTAFRRMAIEIHHFMDINDLQGTAGQMSELRTAMQKAGGVEVKGSLAGNKGNAGAEFAAGSRGAVDAAWNIMKSMNNRIDVRQATEVRQVVRTSGKDISFRTGTVSQTAAPALVQVAAQVRGTYDMEWDTMNTEDRRAAVYDSTAFQSLDSVEASLFTGAFEADSSLSSLNENSVVAAIGAVNDVNDMGGERTDSDNMGRLLDRVKGMDSLSQGMAVSAFCSDMSVSEFFQIAGAQRVLGGEAGVKEIIKSEGLAEDTSPVEFIRHDIVAGGAARLLDVGPAQLREIPSIRRVARGRDADHNAAAALGARMLGREKLDSGNTGHIAAFTAAAGLLGMSSFGATNSAQNFFTGKALERINTQHSGQLDAMLRQLTSVPQRGRPSAPAGGSIQELVGAMSDSANMGVRMTGASYGPTMTGEVLLSKAAEVQATGNTVSVQAHGVTVNVAVDASIADVAAVQTSFQAALSSMTSRQMSAISQTLQGRPMTIISAAKTQSAFENHAQDGVVVVNSSVFNKTADNPALRAALLRVGFTHEMRHEAGVGNTAAEEMALAFGDAATFVNMSQQNPALMTSMLALLNDIATPASSFGIAVRALMSNDLLSSGAVGITAEVVDGAATLNLEGVTSLAAFNSIAHTMGLMGATVTAQVQLAGMAQPVVLQSQIRDGVADTFATGFVAQSGQVISLDA